jgi:hypothetical protein
MIPQTQTTSDVRSNRVQQARTNTAAIANQAPTQGINPQSFLEGATWLNPDQDRTLRPAMEQNDAARQEIEDAMFARQQRLLAPQFQQQERRMQQQLANRGLAAGGEAYGIDNSIFADAQNRAYADAADQAVLAGSNEMQRLFQNDLADRGLIDQRQRAELDMLNQLYGMGGQFQTARDTANIGANASMYGADRGLDAANASAGAQTHIASMNNQQRAREFESTFGLQRDQFDAMLDQQGFSNSFQDRAYGDQLDMANRQQFMNEMGFFLQPGQTYGGNGGNIDVGGAFGNYQQGMNQQYGAQMNQANANWQAQQAQQAQYMQMMAMFGSYLGGG